MSRVQTMRVLFQRSLISFVWLSFWLVVSSHWLPAIQAQTSTGELSVTVLDATGASIAQATVTITGSETGNLLWTLASNDRGLASIPLIPPGNYDISVTAPGFKTTVRPHIPVAVGSIQDLRITLETGSSTQEITVTGQAPLVEECRPQYPARPRFQ